MSEELTDAFSYRDQDVMRRLKQAFAEDAAGLVMMTDKSTGRAVPVLCIVRGNAPRPEDADKVGIRPVALLLGAPFAELAPPPGAVAIFYPGPATT